MMNAKMPVPKTRMNLLRLTCEQLSLSRFDIDYEVLDAVCKWVNVKRVLVALHHNSHRICCAASEQSHVVLPGRRRSCCSEVLDGVSGVEEHCALMCQEDFTCGGYRYCCPPNPLRHQIDRYCHVEHICRRVYIGSLCGKVFS
jgi:hypothetical protein